MKQIAKEIVKETEKQIIAILKEAGCAVSTRYLMKKFGYDMTKIVLDSLVEKRQIVRTRGMTANVELV